MDTKVATQLVTEQTNVKLPVFLDGDDHDATKARFAAAGNKLGARLVGEHQMAEIQLDSATRSIAHAIAKIQGTVERIEAQVAGGYREDGTFLPGATNDLARALTERQSIVDRTVQLAGLITLAIEDELRR